MQLLQYCTYLFVCTVQTVQDSRVGVASCSVQCTLNNMNTVPTARSTAAHSIPTSNFNYFGYCRVLILSDQYRLSIHAAISYFTLCRGPRVLVQSTAGNMTFRLTALTEGSLWPAGMHRIQQAPSSPRVGVVLVKAKALHCDAFFQFITGRFINTHFVLSQQKVDRMCSDLEKEEAAPSSV